MAPEQFELNTDSGQLSYGASASPLLPAGFQYLLRHGETIINQRRNDSGWANSGLDDEVNQLTEAGSCQANLQASKLLAALDQLSSAEPIGVVTSGLDRAKDTAAPFLKMLDAARRPFQVYTDTDLNEINLGAWNNRMPSELGNSEIMMRQSRFEANAQICPPDGESFLVFLRRVQAAQLRINRALQGRIVVIFSHSTTISALRMLALDDQFTTHEGYLQWTGMGLPHGVILKYDRQQSAYEPLTA